MIQNLGQVFHGQIDAGVADGSKTDRHVGALVHDSMHSAIIMRKGKHFGPMKDAVCQPRSLPQGSIQV